MSTDQYQTPPKPSLLDPNVTLSDLDVKLDPNSIRDLDITGLLAFQRAANYLAAAQIFLQSNTLLEKPLTKDDVKPRLLGWSISSASVIQSINFLCVIGHWGTCAGLSLVYAHASYLITRHASRGEDIRMLYVTGPGHGAPGILSTLFIEVRILVKTFVNLSRSNPFAIQFC